MISDQIKSATRSAHQALEKIIVQKIKSIHLLQDYDRLLALFYGFFNPVEERIGHFISGKNFPSLAGRRKSAWLLSDMNIAHGETVQLPVATSLPEINSVSDAFGALYVLEGSTLGGVHIARMIASQAPIPEDQFRFFRGYDDDTAARWAIFLEEMETFATHNPREQDMLIASAQATFRHFERWTIASEQ